MIGAGADLKIYVAMRPIDFRCGHDGLAAKVQEVLRLDPFSGARCQSAVVEALSENTPTAQNSNAAEAARRDHQANLPPRQRQII